MKFRNRRIGALVAVALTASLGLTACGGSSDTSSTSGGNSKGGDISITFLPKNLGNPYFDTSDKGGETAVKEFGGTYSQVGPQDASPDGQAQYIDTAAQKRTSAIVMSANDPKALGDSVKSAQDAGTKVVTFDSDTGPG